VSERLWHPAVIDNGQLVITDCDGSMDGFQLAVCIDCRREYDLATFDTERLLDHLYT
jgi:hypothetical protein